VLAHYGDKVFRLAYSILDNRAVAEDAAQDAFVRVWRALPSYRGLASVSTWVYAIARNTSLTALKRQQARSAFSLDEPAVRTRAENQAAATPGEERWPDLPRLVSRLPEKYRQVILLFYMEEKSYDEVAALLDLPMGTVKTYLHRARKALVEAIREARNS
jgi:RNA polymerase sigma-70 factor (ECF subfamily)